jgi:hypothetical protein
MTSMEEDERNRQQQVGEWLGRVLDCRPADPDGKPNGEDQAGRITPEKGRLRNVLRYVKQSPGRALGGFGCSQVQSQQAAENDKQAKGDCSERGFTAVVPESFNAKAGQQQQADDCHGGEGIVDVVDSADERQPDYYARRNYPKDNGEGKETGDHQAPIKWLFVASARAEAEPENGG